MNRPRLDLLEGRIFQVEQEITEISQQEFSFESDFDVKFSEPEGELWNRVKERGTFESYTNFIEFELISIFRQLVPFIYKHRRRGPMPKINYTDSLIAILVFYKIALEIDTLATFLGYNPSTLQSAISRIRPILNKYLKDQ